MKFIGKKIGMVEVFDKKKKLVPVTIIKLLPSTITYLHEIPNLELVFVQLGYNVKEKFSLRKPELGHFLKRNLQKYQYLKQFTLTNKDVQVSSLSVGSSLSLEYLIIGKKIKVQGKSIGKGNAGNIKKHSFNRGPMSHGSKHHRLQGSMGSGTTPGRVFPGKRMPGRLGGGNTSIANLEIIDLDKERNLLLLKGSVPGKKGNVITLSI